jgi:hypothetical protein
MDLDKGQKELDDFSQEVEQHSERYAQLPKMTFYETKKFHGGFVNEKVYDIDTKEKLWMSFNQKKREKIFLNSSTIQFD